MVSNGKILRWEIVGGIDPGPKRIYHFAVVLELAILWYHEYRFALIEDPLCSVDQRKELFDLQSIV